LGLAVAPVFHVDGLAASARTNRIHADAMRRDFLPDALHHQHHTTLARGIIHVTGPRDDFVNAAHANNFSGGATDLLADAAPLEFADGFARAEKLAGEVHVEHELPVGERHVLDPGVLLKTGVVDEDVNRAEFLDHLLEHGLNLVLLPHVRLVSIDSRPTTHRFLHDGLGGFRTGDVIYDYIGASVCKGQGH